MGAVVIGLALPAFTRYRRRLDYPGDDLPAGYDHPARKGQPAAIDAGLAWLWQPDLITEPHLRVVGHGISMPSATS